MTMSLQDTRKVVAFGYHAAVIGVILLGVLVGELLSHELIILFSVVFAVHVLMVRRNPLCGLVQESLITKAECPACGDAFDLRDFWACACGFTEPAERHAFARCVQCHRSFSWIDCPHCGVGIAL